MIVRKRFAVIPVGACIVLLGLFWVLKNSHREPNRVVRPHAVGIPTQYRGLTLRPGASRQGHVYSRKQAEEDLDQLEWLIDHQYSYRDLKGVDYRACLDAIRSGLGEGITRGDFAYQLAKFLALFGDGHTGVGSGSVSIKNMCSRFLPFLVSEADGRLVAYRADRSDFLDPNYPFSCACLMGGLWPSGRKRRGSGSPTAHLNSSGSIRFAISVVWSFCERNSATRQGNR
ncbi:MAG TPA: hypothetical protein ENI81_10500 [Phycisphaerales bacterium]|nr:hypothetical protein [Phycisphaerales bacterium]